MRITSTRSFSPISESLKRSAFSGSICGASSPCKQQVHLAQEIRERFRLAADDRFRLKPFAVGDGLHLFLKMVIGFDQKSARAAAGSRTVSPSRGSMTSTIKRTTARGV